MKYSTSEGDEIMYQWNNFSRTSWEVGVDKVSLGKSFHVAFLGFQRIFTGTNSESRRKINWRIVPIENPFTRKEHEIELVIFETPTKIA